MSKSEAGPFLGFIGRFSKFGVWPALALLLLIALGFEPRFLQVTNLQEVLRSASILGVVTAGQLLVMLTAGIDLSVGAVIGLTAVAIADSSSPNGPGLVVGLLIMLVVGAAVGAANGLLVTKRQVPPFVATFGMFVVLEGVRVAYTQGSVSGSVPRIIRIVGRGSLAGIPFVTIFLAALVIAGTVFVSRTVTGRHVVATGANERMSRLSGVAIDRARVGTYVACSLLAVIAGVFFAGSVGYVDRFIGRGSDLDSIAAAVLGGASFAGGEGSFVHAAGGALLIAALLSLIVVSGLNIQLQMVAKGLVLIGAISLQAISRRVPSSAGAPV